MSSETEPTKPDAGAQREADVYDVLAWLEVNKKRVAIVALVLVALGFGIATLRYMNEQKELKASGALLALKPTLTPQTNVPPAQPSDLLKVAEQYTGTSAAERARILAATALFTEGHYADAEKGFADFVKGHSESPWVAEAAYGVGAAQEAQNKLNEAQASYQNVATAYANTAVVDDAKLALARIFDLQKKPDQALRLYNELLAPRPGAQPGETPNAKAFEKREALLRAHPELSTNAAVRPLPAAVPASATSGVFSTAITNPAAATPTNAPAPAQPK
jgi:tetratricopeptide (TPR) repeat protein